MLLLFLGNGVLAFSSLSSLLGALYFPGELLQLSHQTLVRQTEPLHLVGIGCRVSSGPPGGRLSTLPCWSCIIGGLVWLLLVF